MLDDDNFEHKHDTFHDNTEVSMGYSSANEPFSQLNYELLQENQEEFSFMFRNHASGIFDEHDEILAAEFQDPEEPSVINDYVFNEAIIGRNIFQRVI